MTRRELRPTGFVHWTRHPVDGGWVYELCGTETPDQGILLSRRLLDGSPRNQFMEYADRRGLTYRAAALDPAGALAEALLVAPPGQLPPRDWLVSLLRAREPLAAEQRVALLSGRSPVPMPSIGRVICSCFNVGEHQIAAAVTRGAASVEEIGQQLRAGTNCGSCRSEIRTLLDEHRLQAAE